MSKIFDFKNFLNKINESISGTDLVGKIDYTLLAPTATEEQILELCEKADKLGVKSVCVLPKMVKIAAEALEESDVLVCTVVSFPKGTDSTEQKLAETKKCIYDGADEVDMVLDYRKLRELLDDHQEGDEGDNIYQDGLEELIDDVSTLVNECHSNTNKDGDKIILKVIVESSELDEFQTEDATHICLNAGADFIKTSTGMSETPSGSPGVAELNKVKIMRDIITEEGSDMKIKASGGIRSMADLQTFAPFVDRFGVGFGSVDSIFGGATASSSTY